MYLFENEGEKLIPINKKDKVKNEKKKQLKKNLTFLVLKKQRYWVLAFNKLYKFITLLLENKK